MKTALKSSMKLGLLTSLYFSQGLPFGFFTQALPVLLRKQGLSLPAIGLALVVGGAIGNVTDRVREGAVMDFLLFHWKDLAWPAFNLADSFITIGVALLIYDGVFGGRKRA